jgi:hypothetical protein
MKPMVKIVAVSAMLLVSAAAYAQTPIKFGVGAGLNVPVSNVKDYLDAGYRGQAMAKVGLPMLPVSVRFNAGVEQMNLKDSVFPATGKSTIISGGADAMWAIPMGPLKPYMLAGLGAYNTRWSMEGSETVTSTRLGLDAGGGIEFPLGMMSGFFETKLQNIFSDSKTSSSLGSSKDFPTRTIPITLGVYFK